MKTNKGIIPTILNFLGLKKNSEPVNGIKRTSVEDFYEIDISKRIEDTIENGIKHTARNNACADWEIEDVIENGVKEVIPIHPETVHGLEEVLQYGIKKTTATVRFDDDTIEDVITDGIVGTHWDVYHHKSKVEGVIKNGVKETKSAKEDNVINPYTFQNLKYERDMKIQDVILNGIKEVQPLPTQDGNKDWGNYYHRQEDRTKPHTEYVNDAVRDGVKETWGYDKQPQIRVNDVMRNGEKI